MRVHVRTEWRKLRSTRSPLLVIAGLLPLAALITMGAMADVGTTVDSAASDAPEALVIGAGLLAPIVLLLLGVIGAAGDPYTTRLARATPPSMKRRLGTIRMSPSSTSRPR